MGWPLADARMGYVYLIVAQLIGEERDDGGLVGVPTSVVLAALERYQHEQPPCNCHFPPEMQRKLTPQADNITRENMTMCFVV